jgi:putative transposase
VWNDALAARKAAHEAGAPFPKTGDLMKTLITDAKRTPHRAWLLDAPAGVLQQSLRDLDQAYRNLFDSLSGKRRGHRMQEPRFKSRKDNRQAARYTRSDKFAVRPNGRLRLPKVGEVAVRWSRGLPSEPSSVTIVKDPSGRYFASLVVVTNAAADLDRFPAGDEYTETGVDLGLTYFAILSDGTKVASPKFPRKAEKKLKRLQQDLARKQKGSNNRAKAASRSRRLTLTSPMRAGNSTTSSPPR